MSFLVDTYALMEWYVQGNSSYEPYFKPGVERHLTKLTLLEFYHQVYHRIGEETAEKYYAHLKGYSEIEDLTEHIIKESGAFRSKMLKKGKRLSYADCVNYVTAKQTNTKLLTGDKEFKGMESVEYVK